MADNILEMKGITKRFPGVTALDSVDFVVKAGEVHSLMGENGAGKSTLIKILTGVYQKDSGTILFDGKKRNFSNTLEAQEAGVSTVYQELNMIPFLSIAENIFLGRYPKKKNGLIDWRTLYSDASAVLKDMGLDIDEHRVLNDCGTATQQMVSIARAVSLNCKLMVLDEPTSSLDADEVNMLFKMINELKARSIAVIFVTHRLEEVYRISDKITVLKDGKYEGTYLPSELDLVHLIGKMVGHSVEQKDKSERNFDPEGKEYIIEMSKICAAPLVKDVSIRIRKGEIVGLAGLLGSGRTETAQVLFGYEQPDSGEIIIEKSPVILKSPKDAVEKKMAFCTENRREEGVIPDMSVWDNIMISSIQKISKKGFVRRKEGNAIVNKYVDILQIKTPSVFQHMRNLSGGNQQKVLLARWLATDPKLMILDEPTRGIDVGAKKEVEILISNFADTGIGVLFISSEMSEMVRNCDRIYVMRDGVILDEISGDEISEENITRIIAEGDHTENSTLQKESKLL